MEQNYHNIFEHHHIITYTYTPHGQPLSAQLYHQAFSSPQEARDKIEELNQDNYKLPFPIITDYRAFVQKLNPLKGDDCQHLYQQPDGTLVSANHYATIQTF